MYLVSVWSLGAKLVPLPPPPLVVPPPCNPPPQEGGGWSLGPKSIENTRCQRRHRKFLQGAEAPEADLHYDTMVQFGGATPPPPVGEPSLHDPPPPWGGTVATLMGRLQGGGEGTMGTHG